MNSQDSMKYLLLGLFLLSMIPAHAQTNTRKAVPIILDTDIGPDYDDVGAMAVLHALADRGEARPLAVIASNQNPLVVPTIDILNTYFGWPDLPIGAPKGKAPAMGADQKWPEMLVQKYPHRLRATSDAPDAVTIYRQVLANQPDKSVTIVTIGFLTNLANLLDSKPDKISRLSGSALVEKKVSKLVSMAGGFPKGHEFNVYIDSVASAKVFNNWPTPIIFSGLEIGEGIKTGLRVVANQQLQSPVKDVYALCLPKAEGDKAGRMSWDQTAVLVAVRGAEPYFKLKPGHFILQGSDNSWKDDPKGPHAYLVKDMPFAQVGEQIETLMMHKGKGKK